MTSSYGGCRSRYVGEWLQVYVINSAISLNLTSQMNYADEIAKSVHSYLNPLLILKPLEIAVLVHTSLKSLALETLAYQSPSKCKLFGFHTRIEGVARFMDMTCVYFPEQLFFECNCLHHVLAFFPRFKIIFSTFSCSALIDSSSL